MACEELTDFLGNIEQKIGKESYEIIMYESSPTAIIPPPGEPPGI
jgi:hypothetical protein